MYPGVIIVSSWNVLNALLWCLHDAHLSTAVEDCVKLFYIIINPNDHKYCLPVPGLIGLLLEVQAAAEQLLFVILSLFRCIFNALLKCFTFYVSTV